MLNTVTKSCFSCYSHDFSFIHQNGCILITANFGNWRIHGAAFMILCCWWFLKSTDCSRFTYKIMIGFFPLVLISWVLFLVGQRKEGLAEGKLHIFHSLIFTWVYSRAPSIRSHRGKKVFFPDFQPKRVSDEPVCIDLIRQNPVLTNLHMRSAVHGYRLW